MWQVHLRAPFSSARLAPRPDGPLTHSAAPRGEKYRASALGLTMISESIQILQDPRTCQARVVFTSLERPRVQSSGRQPMTPIDYTVLGVYLFLVVWIGGALRLWTEVPQRILSGQPDDPMVGRGLLRNRDDGERHRVPRRLRGRRLRLIGPICRARFAWPIAILITCVLFHSILLQARSLHRV